MENVTITKDGYESFHKPGNSTVIEHDFFEGVFSYESLTPTTVITYVFGLLIGVLGPWSIIWYEINCSNRFRTILNQLFARASWYVIVNTIFVMIPEGVRFFYGPYGKTFCDLLFFLKKIHKYIPNSNTKFYQHIFIRYYRVTKDQYFGCTRRSHHKSST